MPKWTETQMREAELIHGPDSMNCDTYRLWLHGEDGAEGKMLDVPGWMVGDPEGLKLKTQAAAVIRERLMEQEEGR